MSGNRFLNRIFEASIVDVSKKLQPQSTMEQRQKYIKIKYEQHLFANQHTTMKMLNQLSDLIRLSSNPAQIFELIVQLFAQDYDIMSPMPIDGELSRNILQLVLDKLEDANYIFIVEFIVQNRDYPKNKYSINYQDREGNTAIHHAVLYNRIECLKSLLKANIKLNLPNNQGLTPLDLAKSLGNVECGKQLMSMLNNESHLLTSSPLSNKDWHNSYSDHNVAYEQHSRTKPIFIKNGDFRSPAFGFDNLNSTTKQRQSKHNRVASDPFNLIKNNISIGGTIKNLPKLLEDRKMLNRTNKSSRHSEKVNSRTISFFMESDDDNRFNENIKNENDYSNKYKAIAGYSSNNPMHLNFRQDDLIVVLDRSNDQYWNGYLETNPQKRGIFPSNLVNLYV